jgi:hypothetical protein
LLTMLGEGEGQTWLHGPSCEPEWSNIAHMRTAQREHEGWEALPVHMPGVYTFCTIHSIGMGLWRDSNHDGRGDPGSHHTPLKGIPAQTAQAVPAALQRCTTCRSRVRTRRNCAAAHHTWQLLTWTGMANSCAAARGMKGAVHKPLPQGATSKPSHAQLAPV